MSVNFKKCPKDIDVINEYNRLNELYKDLKCKFFEDVSKINSNLFDSYDGVVDDDIPSLDCTIVKIRDLEKNILEIRKSIVPLMSVINIDNATNKLFKEYPQKGYINKEQLDSLYKVSSNNEDFEFTEFKKSFEVLKEKVDFDKEIILYEIY